MNKQRRKETANKGFSLVELIIVVAIMAVLVGVLAPQYLRYVERSRISADATTTDAFVNAMQTVASDPEVTLTTTGIYTVTSAANSNTIVVSADLQTALAGILDNDALTGSTYQSTVFTDGAVTLTLAYDTTDNVWEVTETIPAF